LREKNEGAVLINGSKDMVLVSNVNSLHVAFTSICKDGNIDDLNRWHQGKGDALEIVDIRSESIV